MRVSGAIGVGALLAEVPESSSAQRGPDSSAPAKNSEEVLLIELKQKLADDGLRETLATNVSMVYHKIAMSVISNLKA